MTDRRDPVLAQLAEADPASGDLTPPPGVMDAASLLDLVEERVGTTMPTREPLVPGRREWWRGPAFTAAAMVAVLLVIGVSAVLLRGSAGEVAALSCPPGATPDVAGPETQAGPIMGPSVNQGAVFDGRAGRIVFVDRAGATWTFDVCANTWEQVHAPIAAFAGYAAGDLVYDGDSDRTIGIDLNSGINIYDSASGTWTKDASHRYGYARGAVYDPVSGLVVVAFHAQGSQDAVMLRGYDVDTGVWSELGTVENVWGNAWMFLVGYSSDTDELVLHGGYAPNPGDPTVTYPSAAGPTTVLYSLRRGTTTVIPGGPNLFSPWGAWYPYAVGVDGAVIPSSSNDYGEYERLCRLDTAAQTWDCSLDALDAPPRRITGASKMVYDSFNDRLVVIYSGLHVWAIDLETGEWTELR